MAEETKAPARPGIVVRSWRGLRRPSTRWSVLTLVSVGVIVGFVATAGTQGIVIATGTDAFCGGACHSMQWVAKEHRESAHGVNHAGVGAGCHDCHLPHRYPELLWYKAKAGAKDVVAELRGVIDSEDKFKKERLRMARLVWDEYRENNSRNCQVCHRFSPQVLAKQKEFAQPMHKQFLDGQATCIDCHKGVGHAAPAE